MHWHQLSNDQEHARILREYEHASFESLLAMLERQFSVIHNRANVLLTLCGIVVTVTGFSGRLIASTNLAAQILIVAGVTLALLSAAVVVWRVLHLRWLTGQIGDNRSEWLRRCLAYRNEKTHAYRIAIYIMLVGLAAYVAAISIMLLNPTPMPTGIPVR